ncbi:MAG TPA: OmpH family outer membrane protein [Syntrophales bacterium]|nr:OmpH family outer membrane protein [Syntrophales bacterium]
MKKSGVLIMTIFFVLSFSLYGRYAFAAEKIGFIDMREIMIKSDAGKKASQDFSKLYEKDKVMIQKREDEMKKLKDDLEKQRSVLTESAMKEKEAAYQKKFRDYQLMVKDANEELQSRDQELSKKLVPDILKVINLIGDKEKYTLIIDVGSIPVAYFAKENNLTEKVIQEFNKTYKPKN